MAASAASIARVRRSRATWVAGSAAACMGLLLLFAPALLSAGERDVVGKPFEKMFHGHLLGTDSAGRDVFARTILGLRVSLVAALAVIGFGILVGAVVGLIAGFSGGIVDTVLMRFTDVFLALPGPLVALAVVAALGPGLNHTLIAVGLFWWPWYARIVRGQVVTIRRLPHVEAATLGGLSRTRVAVRHVLPGTAGPVIIAASLDIGAVVLVLAGLSFLGLGSPAPAAELGAMTAQGLTYLFNAPWVSMAPATALFVLAVTANVLGDLMRDRLAGSGASR